MVLGLTEASRDWREALVPHVEASGAGRKWMSEKITRNSENLNDDDRPPPPNEAFEGLWLTGNR
jgi:hypothetical protein